jgi:hypothetical protein
MPQITGSSTGATRQAEIDQHSWEFAMRRMSDTFHLSDMAESSASRDADQEGIPAIPRAIALVICWSSSQLEFAHFVTL